MEKPRNKNAIRSKNLIKDAFIKLAMKKDISQIKIREILEVSDLSKGTFYAHYQDIYAVLEEIENENIQRLTGYLNECPRETLIDDFSPFIRNIFKHIDCNKEFYFTLFNSHVAFTFLDKLQKVFVDFMMADKKMLAKLNNKEDAYEFFCFIAVGTASLIQRHFKNNSDATIQNKIDILNNCILNGIAAIKTT